MPLVAAVGPALAAIGGGSALAGGLTVASTAAGLYGAAQGASATKRAAAGVTKAANDSNALQWDIYDRNTNNLTPYLNQGAGATTQINDLLKTNPFSIQPFDYKASPGYEFARTEALRGVEHAFGDSYHSGGAMKALEDRASGLAAQDYGNEYNRWLSTQNANNNITQSYLNALGGQQGVGVQAGSALAGVGQNFANNVGQNNFNAANNQGNAALVGANNTNALISNLVNTGANAFGQYTQGRGSSYAPKPAAGAPYDPLTGFPGYGGR